MNIIEFRHDPGLLGAMPHMRDPATQERWDVFLKAVYGLEMSDAERAIFAEHTHRDEPRTGGYPNAVAITGTQSGKSQTAGDIVAYETAIALTEHRPTAAGAYALLVAQDHRGAIRVVFDYATKPFAEVPMLATHVVSRSTDSLRLDNHLTIGAYPCRPSSVRGIRAIVCVIDELAFFRSSENVPTDVEMRRVVASRVATTGGKVITLSSPYGQSGALWELHRQHFGREDSSTLVWVGSAPAMNPTLAADYLQRMREDDPEGYRSEVEGEFRTGTVQLFDPDALEASAGDYRELLPAPGLAYWFFYDASGGKHDASTLAVAHREGERTVVDFVRAWLAPHNPEQVIAEAAELVKRYGGRGVCGDRYAGRFPATVFQRCGISYTVSELDRSQLYLELLPQVLAGAVQIPNDPALLRELRGLERKRGFAGRDRVDHRAGAHDDRANALAGVVSLMAKASAWRRRDSRVIYTHGSGTGAWGRSFTPETVPY